MVGRGFAVALLAGRHYASLCWTASWTWIVGKLWLLSAEKRLSRPREGQVSKVTQESENGLLRGKLHPTTRGETEMVARMRNRRGLWSYYRTLGSAPRHYSDCD